MPANRITRKLNDLDDVGGTPSAGQVLAWTGAQWQPAAGGGGGESTYVYTQNIASAEWVISHNLGRFPSVTVVDSGLNMVAGDVQYNSNNQLTIRFSAAFGGTAYLN